MAWHPKVPRDLQDAVSRLVDRNIDCVSQALMPIEPTSPAFALCLETSDVPEDVYPIAVSLGLEQDRERLVEAGSEWDAWYDVWHSVHYSYLELKLDDPSEEPEFALAARRVVDWLSRIGEVDFARWVLEEVAARLTRQPPPIPTTDDFVAYPSHQGEEIIQSLRWIAPAEIQRKLEEKRLLVDNPDELEGAPEYES
jgi:hypothetical protein